jgi:cytochrome c2
VWRAAAALALFLAGGCAEETIARRVEGDPETGRALVAAYQCGVCHTIPGVRGARGVVGPPLTGFAARAYIGGRVPNTPENRVRWILDPSALAPETAMPTIGLDALEARDVAAYLETLR